MFIRFHHLFVFRFLSTNKYESNEVRILKTLVYTGNGKRTMLSDSNALETQHSNILIFLLLYHYFITPGQGHQNYANQETIQNTHTD